MMQHLIDEIEQTKHRPRACVVTRKLHHDMLARLQQALTLGALIVATLWAWLCLQAGHAGWAAAGASAILLGYAAVLALEMLMLRWAHDDDPAPRASAAALFRAWLGEVVSAPIVFCWRQPFRSQRWPDLLPTHAQGQRGVVLIHGLVCNRGLWNPWLKRLTVKQTPFVAINLEPVFGSIDDYVPIIDHAVRAMHSSTGLAPVVVAHSMGGLALRRWWVQPGNDQRVLHAVTIGTPHHGTWLARWAMTRNTRQMQQGSHWLTLLAQHEPASRASRFTCFYGHCDNIVFPPSTATLAGADNRLLTAVAHVHMADRSEPFDELQRWLDAPASAQFEGD